MTSTTTAHTVEITSLPVPGRPGAIDYTAVCSDGCGVLDRSAHGHILVSRVANHGPVVDHSRHAYPHQARLIG